MYKIFINEKPFVIASHATEVEELRPCEIIDYKGDDLLPYIKKCESLHSKGIVLITPDIEAAFKQFADQHILIVAAGGVVFNEKEEILVIKRMGKWDLPKGKLDSGESIEQAALREVEEECGITGLAITKSLPTLYHTYKINNHRFLKQTYWFAMETQYNGKLVPQLEEQITEVKWMKIADTIMPAFDTYASIRNLLLLTAGN